MPKTPEQWLAETAPQEKAKGTLKLFLGYAPGVGKTYGMLVKPSAGMAAAKTWWPA